MVFMVTSTLIYIAPVLLPTRTYDEVQILLESRVGLFLDMPHHTCSPSRFRPDVTFFCDLDYDPFLVMQDQGKVYGAPPLACINII